MALEALRGDKTIQEIAARHQVHSNQVSTWKRQAVEVMADVFARGGKPECPTEAEDKELHAKIGRLCEPFVGADDGKGHHWPSFFITAVAARSAPMHPASRASL